MLGHHQSARRRRARLILQRKGGSALVSPYVGRPYWIEPQPTEQQECRLTGAGDMQGNRSALQANGAAMLTVSWNLITFANVVLRLSLTLPVRLKRPYPKGLRLTCDFRLIW